MIGRVFTADFGVLGGIFKAGAVAKTKPMLGQFGRVSWNARLDSQLGAFHFESEKNIIAGFFNSPEKLNFANACFALVAALLPEREAYPKLYEKTLAMLASPTEGGYLDWELCLLAELGYGLALDRCGNCGRADGLCFVSPKTGRAICAACGKDYADKMFPLPVDLDATRFFLEQVAELPPARKAI